MHFGPLASSESEPPPKNPLCALILRLTRLYNTPVQALVSRC